MGKAGGFWVLVGIASVALLLDPRCTGRCPNIAVHLLTHALRRF